MFCLAAGAAVAPRPLDAQAPDDADAGRSPALWGAVGLGAGRQAQGCVGCRRTGNEAASTGGAAARLALGLDVSRRVGVGVVGHLWSARNSADLQGRGGWAALLVVDLRPWAGAAAVALRAGAGLGRHFDEPAIAGATASGPMLGAGVGVRLPARSAVGVELAADYLHMVGGGRVAPNPGFSTATAYRPRLLTVTLNLALGGRR